MNVEGAFNPNAPVVKKAALKIDADDIVIETEESDTSKLSTSSNTTLKKRPSVLATVGSSYETGNKTSDTVSETIPEDSQGKEMEADTSVTGNGHTSALNNSRAVPATPEFGNARDTVGSTTAEEIANSGKAYRKKHRTDNKVQKYTVNLSPGPDNKNPLYSLKLHHKGIVVAETVDRFAAHRDLFTKLNADKFCDQVLSAPFPITYGFSKLGVKMSESQIQDRRSKLYLVHEIIIFI